MLARLVDTPRREARRARAWLIASPWNRAAVAAILVYGVVFSILTCLRVLALSAFAWDLGIFNQGMYTTVTQGKFFAVSILPGLPEQSLFAGHFSPILLLLLIPYALFPSLFTLVVLQTWGIALAALPIYCLGQRLLGTDRLPFVLALAFLLSPATQGVNWYDFHTEAFIPLALGLAFYFYETRSWKWFLVAIILTLSTIEMAAVLVTVFALGGLAAEVWGVRVEGKTYDRPRTWILAVTLGVAVGWVVLASAVSAALNPQGGFFPGGNGSWTILGAANLGQVPIVAVLHPDRVLAALAFDAVPKAWYLLLLFVPLQLLTLRSPRALAGCLPWLTVSLLSNYPSFYLVGNQYPAYVLPFLFYGAVLGIARPWRLPKALARVFRWPFAAPNGTRPLAYGRTILSLSIIFLLVASPLGPWALGSDTTGRLPILDAHDRAVLGLYDRIPADASVLTQNNLYPLLSTRSNVHFVPVNMIFTSGSSFNSTMNGLVGSVDYLLADLSTSFVEAALIVSWPGVSENYSVVASGDGAVLLEHGLHALESFVRVNRTVAALGVIRENATLAQDPAASTGWALLHENLTTDHFWFGPYLILPPGNYTVAYRLKVDRLSVGPVVALPVLLHPLVIDAQVIEYGSTGQQVFFTANQSAGQVTVAVHTLYGQAIPSGGAYFWVSTTFDVRSLGVYEFPGHDATGSLRMWFDEVNVLQNRAFISGNVSMVWS